MSVGPASWVRRGALAWRLACSGLVVLVVFGSLAPPPDDGGPSIPIPDWAQHAIAYALLMATLVASQAMPRMWLSALSLIVLGAVLEVIQGQLGYRVAEAKDLLANAAGIAVVAAAAAVIASGQGRHRVVDGT